MVYRILVLPNMPERENFLKIWEKLKDTPAFKIERDSDIQCRKNGVFHEKQDGTYTKIETETTEFIIHPESGITQADIDTASDDTAFGNLFSTFAFNRKKCCIVVLKQNQTINVNAITAQLISNIKRADKIPDNEVI